MIRHLKTKTPYLVLIGLAAVGLIDAAYLTYHHYVGGDLICNISHGCEKVLTSQYAVVGGVPVALLGVVYYLAVLLLAVFFLTNRPQPKLLIGVGLVGFLPTLYLFFLQAFVLHAWCQYCLLSTMTSTAIFVTSVIAMIKSNKEEESHGQAA